MARWGSLMDVMLKNNPSLNGQFVPSTGGLFSATLAASSAAAVAASTPFAYRALLGVDGRRLASCDAGPRSPIFTEDYLTGLRTASETLYRHDTLNYITKECSIEHKPLFSAFTMKAFALTTIKSFLCNYLPLLPLLLPNVEDDDNDFEPDSSDERHVDLVVPFKKSVKDILRATSGVITRCVLERFVVHDCSQHASWKLLKGHFLGVAASWLVEVGIECYHCVRDIIKSKNEGEDVDVVVQNGERAKVLGKRVCDVTVRCGASLVFASIGVTLFRPTNGESIGCQLGEMVGPIIMSFCLANEGVQTSQAFI